MSSIGGSGGSNIQAPVVFGGLVSGLNTTNIISQLMAANKAALQPIQAKITQQQTKASAFAQLNASLSSLLSTVKNFKDANYLQGAQAAVTPGGTTTTASVSATATAGATVGSFKVTVDQLASASYVASPNAIGAAVDPTALLKDDKLGLTITAGKFTVNGQQVTIDPTTDTLNSAIGKIQAAAPGTTVSLVPDSSGRNNLLQLSNAGGVTLGSGGDTSNFLSATNLLASPSGTTRTSTGNMGVTQTGSLLQSANLVTPLSQPTGDFLVNGVDIQYDATKDSLSQVLSRINSSAAGVTASYNAANDTITFVNKTTGSTGITLQDQTGNFLSAISVASASQHLGTNAKYEVDTGSGATTYYSTNNTVSNAVPGVTLNLLKTGTVADTVTISQDQNAAVGTINAFIGQFNGVLDQISALTATSTSSTPGYNGAPTTTTTQNGPLTGNYNIQQIGYQLHQILGSNIDGVNSGLQALSQIGITFGAVGSAGGSTNHLVLDETKFRAALQNNPAGVANVFAAFQATGTLAPGGANVQSIGGNPTLLRVPGSYSMTTVMNGNGSATVTAIFTPSDGGPASTTVDSHVTAGSNNQNLIPGMTLTFNGSLQAGTDTINIGTPTRGMEAKLEQFLNPLTATGGAITQLQNDTQTTIKTLNAQITTMNKSLQATQLRLQRSFSNMEIALAKLKEQQSALTSIVTQTSSSAFLGG